MPLGEDFTRWSRWWEFQKDPFVNLKSRVQATGVVVNSADYFMGAGQAKGSDTLRPTQAQILKLVVPALRRSLEVTSQRDITSSCMVALAKIGLDGKGKSLIETLKAGLKSRDQEIRETAALSLGISQRPEAVADLISLLADSDEGRKLCDRSQVDDRTRAFAAYGLGLIAYQSNDGVLKRDCYVSLATVIESADDYSRNIIVAVINAMGLLRPENAGAERDALFADAVATLELYYLEDHGAGSYLMQAQVPPAIAALLKECKDAAQLKRYKNLFLQQLTSQRRSGERYQANLQQSAAIALGQLSKPNETGSPDVAISKALFRYYEQGRNAQAGYFALMAMARIGGIGNRDLLLRALRTGSKALQKPWAAMALGVYVRGEQQRANDRNAVDEMVGRELLETFSKVKSPETVGAIAVSLGLMRYEVAGPALLSRLVAERHQDELGGYICMGIGLLRYERAVETLRDIIQKSSRRPALMRQAAVALGLLGDKGAADLLLGQMVSGDQNVAKMASLAFALGQIGDSRSIEPLVEQLLDESIPDLSRAFAAVALGGVSDKEIEPWNAKIGRVVNYRAAVGTLTNQISGILDIL